MTKVETQLTHKCQIRFKHQEATKYSKRFTQIYYKIFTIMSFISSYISDISSLMAVLGPIPELRGPEQERHEDPEQGQAGRHHIEQDRLKEVS